MPEPTPSIESPTLISSEAVFAVKDLRESVDFYLNVLGFESRWLWGDPPTFAGVRWGTAQVMLCLDPARGNVEGLQHWFRVTDVDDVYRRQKSAGAQIIQDIENKPWGFREYTVRDPNGYHLRFAGPPTYERPATATDSIPPEIQIVTRVATVEECAALRRSVNWEVTPSMITKTIEQTPIGIVAIDTTNGETVGMVRVCGDGNYFTIWDVIVHSDYQRKKIGTAMMQAALAEVKKVGEKGSFVALFTGKPDFYRKVGFAPDSGAMSRNL